MSREYSGCSTRSPSGVSSCTRSGCCGRWGASAPGTGSTTSVVWCSAVTGELPRLPRGRGRRLASVVDVSWRRGVAPLTHGDTGTPSVDNTTHGRSAQGHPTKLRTMSTSRTSMHVRLSNVPDVDATDARLLLALNEDPRASVMALSQRLGLARNTVQARLARLETSGVLTTFERRVRPEALGYRLRAYVTVQVVQHSLSEVSDALAHIPEVLEVIGLSGVVDLLVEVAARDADDLWRITEQVLGIPGVQRTDTALALPRFVDLRMAPLLERSAGTD